MAAVTKSSGRYFYDFERVWTEARDTGVLPFWVRKDHFSPKLPAQPNPQVVQSLMDGRAFLPRVQANRVGCFDLTVSFSKSVSLLAYGLTPPAQQRSWTDALRKIATPEVETLLANQRINSGQQGKDKQPSQGVAVGFAHSRGYLGQPNAHIHYAIPNVSAGEKKYGSIANAHEMFEKQGVIRARVQKGVDDFLQSRGIETVREGKKVEIAGVPKELRDELSPARRAMKEAQSQKEFSGPKAQDFYARQARRDAGPRVDRTPQEVHRDCKELAARYGVTLESLTKPKPGPAAARDAATEMLTALRVAKDAAAVCTKKHGSFSADQFQEKLFTLAIGKPTTVQALDTMGKAALNDRSIADIKQRTMPDGTTRYSTKESKKVERAAERPYQPDTKEAWESLKVAAKGLGSAVFIKTATKATEVAARLTELVRPERKTVSIDASRVPNLIDACKPTPYLAAHAKALTAGLLKGSGNPHERAGFAAREYAKLRSHERLPKGSVVIVENALSMSAREMDQLSMIAKRDKAHVVLTDFKEKELRQTHQRARNL